MVWRVATWDPVVLTVAAGTLALGAAPAPPRPMPPLPVAPVERRAMPPYLARITMSGDTRMSGVFEECVDPAAITQRAQAHAKARPASAPPPMTGCTSSHQIRPDHTIHGEIACDQAKGATSTFRMVSDGTPNDLRMHTERYDPAAAKTTVVDSHLVRLGPCPADLAPGQMRRPGGPIIDKGAAAKLLENTRGGAS
jgi:hypothetical protein